MSKIEPFTSYEAAWDYVYGSNEFSAKADAWFLERFPEGHDSSIRPLAARMHEILKERGYEYKATSGTECNFHIRALELLIAHGVDYKPDLSKVQEFREFERQPGMGQCFSNSWTLMEGVNSRATGVKRLTYVEGLVWGYLTDPVLHAWNSYGVTDSRSLDWSHYIGCQWNRYLGISFTQEEQAELQALVFPNEPLRPISFFDGKFFPLVENRLLELLANREPPTLGN